MAVLSRIPVRSAAIAFAAAATLTVAACGGGTQTATSSAATTSSTSSPAASSTAASSSPSTSSSPSSTATSATGSSSTGVDATHNDTDVTFVQMMIPHHQGAIAMADLAPTRAASAEVKDLAATIKAAQGPEIEQMTSWLQAWGVTTSSSSAAPSSSGDMGGMDHGGMTGMGKDGEMTSMSMPGEMTAEQMTQLEAASGAEFDRMFLEMMITHHQGAVEMAQTEIDGGANADAIALAQSIRSSQTEEIAQMQQLLQTL